MRKYFAVILLAVIVMVGHLCVSGWYLKSMDAKYYATIARELLESGQYQGVKLNVPEVATIDQMIEHDQPWPVSYCRPGFPLLLAGFFALFGASNITYQLVNILSFCLLAYAVYRISKAINNSAAAGFYTVGLLVAAPVILNYGTIPGLEMPFAVLIVLATLLMLKARDWPSAMASGGLLGIAMFLRPTALAFLPIGLLSWNSCVRLRRAKLLAFILAFVVTTVIGYGVEGMLNPAPLNPAQPFNITAFSLMWNWQSNEPHVLQQATWADVAVQWREILEKLARNLMTSGERLGPYWLIALAVLGLATRRDASTIDRLAAATGASALLIVLGIGLTSAESLGRHALPITALLAAFAGGGIAQVVSASRNRFGRFVHLCLMMLLVAVVSYPRLARWAEQAKISNALAPSEAEKAGTHLRKHTPDDAIIMGPNCALPFVHWDAQRRAVEIPINPEGVGKVIYNLIPVDAVLFCQEHNPETYERADELLSDFALVDGFDAQHRSIWHCHYKLYVRKKDMPAVAASKAGPWKPGTPDDRWHSLDPMPCGDSASGYL